MFLMCFSNDLVSKNLHQSNVLYLQQEINRVLSREFIQNIHIGHGDIIRVMERVCEGRLETVERMNERVVMTIVNDFKTHQLTRNKHIKWEENFVSASSLHDSTVSNAQFDSTAIKLRNNLGKPRVGGTGRFYFT